MFTSNLFIGTDFDRPITILDDNSPFIYMSKNNVQKYHDDTL